MLIRDITATPGVAQWRDAARDLLSEGVPPQEVMWRHAPPGGKGQGALFGDGSPPLLTPPSAAAPRVPKAFIEAAETALCSSGADRFALCYRILWRLTRGGEKGLLHRATDDDIIALARKIKAVRRDGYKIKAFLRFRELPCGDGEYFIARYEPEHYSLERVLPFFVERFRNMRWSILTPYRGAHWDMRELTLEDAPDLSQVPAQDAAEARWLAYYANIFNPARVKIKAMNKEMPKKYRKHMPEAALIDGLIEEADARVRRMLEKGEGD